MVDWGNFCAPRFVSSIRRMNTTRLILLTVLFGAFANLSHAQRWAPTHLDVAYDDKHDAQKLDVYLPDTDEKVPVAIYIHGGGWRAGSKYPAPGFLMHAVRDKLLAVVSVEYRFTDVEIHPAQVNDCLRAVQFVRENAAKWNIDAERIVVGGGSAGGHLSLWVALHDDIADPDSEDSVARQSSRVSGAISFAGPTDWSLLGEMPHLHPAYRQLLGYRPGTPYEDMDKEKVADVSSITHADKKDPAVLLVHGDKDNIVPLRHAEKLHERIKEVGGKSELLTIKGGTHAVSGGGGTEEKVLEFIKRQLKISAPGK